MTSKSAKVRVNTKNSRQEKAAANGSSSLPAKKTDDKTAEKNGGAQINRKALKELISKGTKQGYLTYDEINEVLPEDMLSAEQIEETLILFDDHEIDILDEKSARKSEQAKKLKQAKIKERQRAVTDFGAVTDPVKMYLREMGMVTLLSREGEVEIAKKIEAGEQEVLRAVLDTINGVESILELGDRIEKAELRPKYVLRDIDEGDTYVDEAVQTEKFLNTIRSIREIHLENIAFREKLFFDELEPGESRRVRRSIKRRNARIFELLKEWRLEGSIIDDIEQRIIDQIEWFDRMSQNLMRRAGAVNSPLGEVRN
ncbi:MAG: RNA polymerase sigma factor region1.1 domain-containing protein, partial [Desulfobacterales bacterium]